MTKDCLWITNISNKIINLSDLNVIIYPMRSINLLDGKHYSLTKEQIEKSALNGSLKLKQDSVVIRQFPPGEKKRKFGVSVDTNATFPTKQRSSVEVEKVYYEELDISDDSYAAENAEIAEAERTGKRK